MDPNERVQPGQVPKILPGGPGEPPGSRAAIASGVSDAPVTTTHSLPGDNVPRTPGGTPWVPTGTPTSTAAPTAGPSHGNKPPGWGPLFKDCVTALMANPNYNPSIDGVSDSLMTLAGLWTDKLLAKYPAGFQ